MLFACIAVGILAAAGVAVAVYVATNDDGRYIEMKDMYLDYYIEDGKLMVYFVTAYPGYIVHIKNGEEVFREDFGRGVHWLEIPTMPKFGYIPLEELHVFIKK